MNIPQVVQSMHAYLRVHHLLSLPPPVPAVVEYMVALVRACAWWVSVSVSVCVTPHAMSFPQRRYTPTKQKKPYLGTCISISRRPIIQLPTIETYSVGKSDHQKHKFLIIYSRTGKNLTSSHLTSIKKNKTLSPLISSYPRVTHTHTHTQKSKEFLPHPSFYASRISQCCETSIMPLPAGLRKSVQKNLPTLPKVGSESPFLSRIWGFVCTYLGMYVRMYVCNLL